MVLRYVDFAVFAAEYCIFNLANAGNTIFRLSLEKLYSIHESFFIW